MLLHPAFGDQDAEVGKGWMQNADGLTKRSRRYIEGIRAHYVSEPLPEPPSLMPIAYVK